MNPTTANFLGQWDPYVLLLMAGEFIAMNTVAIGLSMLVKYTIRAVKAS